MPKGEKSSSTTKPKRQPKRTVGEKHRALQKTQDKKDASKLGKSLSSKQAKKGVQTGMQKYPETPLPRQHLSKPGIEAELLLKPLFMAPDYKGSEKLLGLTAIITGGDSGIGRAVAVLFAREGADVVIVYLEEHIDAAETQRCIEAEGRSCLAISGDVKNPKFCKQVVVKTIRKYGKVDILVNNAAFQEHADGIDDVSEERFDLTLRTNVYGYFHMAKAVVPHLKRGSCIINTGSVTGLMGSKMLLDYSTSKGAIHAFTKALAANLIDKGVRVNAVAPGPVWTPLNPADKSRKDISEFGAKTDMKRPAQPEELSPAYVFLASPASASYITGIVLPITGSVGE